MERKLKSTADNGQIENNIPRPGQRWESEIAFGHIIPKYAVPYIDVEILRQCVEKTQEKVEFVVLDWKGIKGEHKSKLVEMLEEIGVPFKKV